MSSNFRILGFLFERGGKLEIARGLQTVFAFAVPLMIGKLTSFPEIGSYVGLAAIFFVLGDVGGLYKTRALTTLATIVGCSVSLFISTFLGSILWLKVLITGLWLFGAGYATVYGHPGTMMGMITGLFFLFGIELPGGDWLVGLQRVLICLVGGGWGMFLCLVMWPLRPFQPLRSAVAGCYQAIAQYIQGCCADSIAELEGVVTLKQALQSARDALSVHRMGRMGGSPLGEILIVLIEDADRLITSVVSLRELVEVYRDSPQFLTVSILIDDAEAKIALVAQNLAQVILGKLTVVDLGSLELIAKAIAQQKQFQRQVIQDNTDDYATLMVVGRLVVILELVIKQLKSTIAIASDMDTVPRKHQPKGNVFLKNERDKLESKEMSWFEPLQDNFTLDSSLFLHGLRLGVTNAVAVTIYSLTNISQGFWVTLTILLVLQPDVGNTFQRFFHRIIGTILGVVFTVVLLAIISSEYILEGISILSIAIAYSLLRFHYGVAVFFISIFAMILSELKTPVGGGEIALMRIGCTLLGAGLAVVAVFFLFREREEKRLSAYLAALIDSTRSYFQTVMAVYLGEAEYEPLVIGKERQKNRLAYFNAQASFQRFSSDPQTKMSQIEPVLTLINYLNRFSRSVTVLMAQLEHFRGTAPVPELVRFVALVEGILAQFATSLTENTRLPSLRDLEVSEQQIQGIFHDFQAVRLEEFAANMDSTPTRQFLRDFSILGVEIEAINDQLAAIHSAVTRIIKCI
ncbi:MAG: FUSC family protein [Gomphosphaeria aponina SAG 52.96 = DSM 107014]|uniref:FUSC family protein n=1 Tax=Gomphosphaeria aponina SAG 52.96 = DSM 107014 TaxID=1521640 RepID=A0A941GUQ5_9CHRO|nr:FUSC family protein [Gomphosphaeria aponina SAG 52.96 = DSM 107014]